MRRTRHRRRFHTDRIVAARRARWLREQPEWVLEYVGPLERHRSAYEWRIKQLTYGRLANTDPWDCGNPRCGICHAVDHSRRAREEREWRALERAAW